MTDRKSKKDYKIMKYVPAWLKDGVIACWKEAEWEEEPGYHIVLTDAYYCEGSRHICKGTVKELKQAIGNVMKKYF